MTLVSVALTGWAGRRERAYVERSAATWMTVAGFVGQPLGLVLLARAGDGPVTVLMAATVLVTLAIMATPVRLPAGPATTWLTGITSGALLTSTGMNGPPLVLGLSARGLAPRPFRATLQVILCLQDLTAIAGFLVIGRVDRAALAVAAVGVLVSPLGWRLGEGLFDRIPTRGFRVVLVVGLAVVAGMLGLQHLA